MSHKLSFLKENRQSQLADVLFFCCLQAEQDLKRPFILFILSLLVFYSVFLKSLIFDAIPLLMPALVHAQVFATCVDVGI
jgi:hypothetical protein